VVLTHMELADPRAYVRLAAILRQQITDGFLRPSDRAPSITRLSQEHRHARPTCGKALRMLEGEGLVTRVPGLGYFVNHRTGSQVTPTA